MTPAKAVKLAPVSREQLMAAESALLALKQRYLEEHGWEHTCQTPGSTWLWTKLHLDDKYMCNLPMALCIEEFLSAK